jgi:NitT/TauT family transport system ATP-binding protein
MAAPILEVSNLGKVYGRGESAMPAVKNLNFEIHESELVCIVGPSGCGKTTLLRCISGLLPPSEGSIKLAGRTIDEPPSEMAVVFQDYSRSLLPWLNVRDNVKFPLRGKVSRHDAAKRADAALESVGLGGFPGHYPWELSGGMQQRVSIARALAYQSRILVMDEPFASVDAQTRADLEDLVLRVRDEYGVTVLFVTHDVDEAVYLADRVLVLSSRPASVDEELHVPLARPRDQVTTREIPEFTHLRSHVFSLIKRRILPAPQ